MNWGISLEITRGRGSLVGYMSRLILKLKIHGGCVLPASNDMSCCHLKAEVSNYSYGRWDDYHQKVYEMEEEN